MSDVDLSEVIKIRISERTKKILQDTAEKEYRTFAEQCRMILDKWVYEKKKMNNAC